MNFEYVVGNYFLTVSVYNYIYGTEIDAVMSSWCVVNMLINSDDAFVTKYPSLKNFVNSSINIFAC